MFGILSARRRMTVQNVLIDEQDRNLLKLIEIFLKNDGLLFCNLRESYC